MAQVTGLTIKLQTGTTNTQYATWKFDDRVTITTSTGSGGISVGSWVRIKNGARSYNGVQMDSWVFNDEFQVYQISGDRVVINRNRAGNHAIMTAFHASNLTSTSGGGSSTTVVTGTLDHFTVSWAYDSGDGIWFSGGSSDTKEYYATYSPPTNAIKIRCTVTPVSTTRQVNGQDTAYWTGTAVSKEYSMEINPPETPSVPTVEIEEYDLTASLENITDSRCDEVQFEVYDGTVLFSSGTGTVVTAQTSYRCKLNAGGLYRVRARAVNLIGTSTRVYSAWSNYSSAQGTIPSTPNGITTIRATSSTSVYLAWDTVNSAETYDVEYTTNVDYFDGSDSTTTKTGIEFNHFEVVSLETGDEYFFRVRAVNEQGESGWSGIKSVVIGKKPAAPTTWSSATTVITGDVLRLYWVHNAQDGSKETYAEVEVTVGNDTNTYTIQNPTADDDEAEVETRYYEIDTSKYKEGTLIKWRVRTAGITKTYGDWSIMRNVNVYAPPTLAISLTNQNGDTINVLQSFPFFIKGLAGPNTQEPIGYHVEIIANSGYETVDNLGRAMIVNPGDSVYSKYIDTNDPLLVEMSANNVDLENGISYAVNVTVSMNSGLTATDNKIFDISWSDQQYPIDAEIAIDPLTYVSYVTPYCRDEDGNLIPNLSMAVYRREFDGQFTEIASGLDSSKYTVVTDPHPALDYARYRIIVTDKVTGAISFYDPPGYPMGCHSVVIQWEEAWTDFESTGEEVTVQPPWTGSILTLPYNIDVSEDSTPEATLVKYVGRTYPVSYYGTQIDSSASWNVEIPKSDKETVYALRRLAIWQGDAYVREPSGSGYWANITVSFSQKHLDLVIPVTLTIKRVAGGV